MKEYVRVFGITTHRHVVLLSILALALLGKDVYDVTTHHVHTKEHFPFFYEGAMLIIAAMTHFIHCATPKCETSQDPLRR